jgi:excinuclease UvrABC helicase subunit UvrB
MPTHKKKLSEYLQLSEQQLQTLSDSSSTENDPFLPHLLRKLDEHIAQKGKILLITLTKKSSEEVTNFLVSKGYKAFYLHSEVATMERRETIKKLKT